METEDMTQFVTHLPDALRLELRQELRLFFELSALSLIRQLFLQFLRQDNVG